MATVRHLGLFPFCPTEDDLTYKDTYESFLTTGGFTFPKDYENGKFSPFKLTVEQALAIQWRIKIWRFIAVQAPFGNDGDYTQWGGYTGNDERQLVCYEQGPPIGVNESQLDSANPFFQMGFESSRTPILRNKENTLFANISLEGFVSDTEIRPLKVSLLEDVLVGWRFEAKLYDTVDLDFFKGETICEFRPVEYFPYDPGDGGGPIYDSATGAQLREFPAN